MNGTLISITTNAPPDDATGPQFAFAPVAAFSLLALVAAAFIEEDMLATLNKGSSIAVISTVDGERKTKAVCN
ncbi:hypothetical protein DL766_000233 [Monosporascus sp. MC13-8B]|uniref:Uncharacterized protein n=1 Tax=Monosporascus cannonballus TaxID=155416 RepID=A0ABY0H528_9PEZI|nr:hypothetical protein DL762_005515 [Monosporascus cannonballus]RYO93099.1 hypothetical protein DL763_004495 [Monosporascus cannonballus]RYP39791.1 hypothetical protein DL766_000233 [Monosporascus sp. MC13-8B]